MMNAALCSAHGTMVTPMNADWTNPSAPDDTVAQAVLWACLQEVNAFKPGNVSPNSPAHDMSAADFHASARAISTAMTLPHQTVGERILAGIEATRRVTAKNTNLGIVLLFAPLISAWYRAQQNFESLQDALSSVLAALSVADAQAAYQAIALANPGGLGQRNEHDVHQPATITLLQAMTETQGTDQIARAYANHYHWFWNEGLALWREAQHHQDRSNTAILQLYLEILARQPDSHILRRYGMETALQVSQAAQSHLSRVQSGPLNTASWQALKSWDQSLKSARINPGTTADLLAAVLFMDRLLHPQG